MSWLEAIKGIIDGLIVLLSIVAVASIAIGKWPWQK